MGSCGAQGAHGGNVLRIDREAISSPTTEWRNMEGKKFRVNCGSKYFQLKHGPDPVIEIEREMDFHQSYGPPVE